MKAISLWQPWATLWLLSDPDEKVFETRDWYTSFRGDLLVHAAKARNLEVRQACADQFFRERLAVHGLTPETLPYGALIGKVRLVGCCQMQNMPVQSERERSFGFWSYERYAWERAPRPVRFEKPILYKGSQGFFEVPYSQLAEVA